MPRHPIGAERRPLPRPQREDTSHLNQFIIHAALDMVDDSVWGTTSMYLKCVHKFNGAWLVQRGSPASVA